MKYSLITPVYNRADCIARCLDSVVHNLCHGVDLEHIVVDDGSTDGTGDIIADYAARYPHLSHLSFPANRGTNAARNAAIEAATGDYCILLDSDDQLVNDAILYIDETVAGHPEYRYFAFAPDDMQEKYAAHPLLNVPQTELNYQQFLTGQTAGDFIHVIPAPVLKAFPFDPGLRIYEGIFFLHFYKEVQKILFTNRVVTLRERSRQDSVTRESIRTRKIFIERNIKAEETFLGWYQADLEEAGATGVIQQHRMALLDNLLLVSEYKKATALAQQIQESGYTIPSILRLVLACRLGEFYRLVLKIFLVVKYNVLKSQLQ